MDDKIHSNAVLVLNKMGRNKANYIANLVWEKESQKGLLKSEGFKEVIKAALIEGIKENPNLFCTNNCNGAITNENKNSEFILNEEQKAKNIANGLNKEIIQGLNAFGVK